VCTDRQLAAWVECGQGDNASCQEFNADRGLCSQCIGPADALSGRWGPLVVRPGTYETAVNAPGCGALINHDTSTTGCGKKLADYTGCVHYACDHCNTGDNAFDAYNACALEADHGGCKPELDAVKSGCTKDIHDCYVRPTDQGADRMIRVIKLFCGTP